MKKISKTDDCRLCSVIIEGRQRVVPTCPVDVGMKVTAFDQQLKKPRKVLLEALLKCVSCECRINVRKIVKVKGVDQTPTYVEEHFGLDFCFPPRSFNKTFSQMR